MGLFYANMTVYRPQRAQLLTALDHLQRTAFLSPTVNGHTVIFDEGIDGQDAAAIEQLGRAVTEALECAALAAFLHDDDVLYLWLFQNGRVLDRYDSLPQYFDPDAEPGPPEGGNASLLCKAFDRADRAGPVEQLLRANLLDGELPDIAGEQERHAALACELGIPAFVAGVGYEAIAGKYVADEFQGVVFEAVSTAKRRRAAEPRDVV